MRRERSNMSKNTSEEIRKIHNGISEVINLACHGMSI